MRTRLLEYVDLEASGMRLRDSKTDARAASLSAEATRVLPGASRVEDNPG